MRKVSLLVILLGFANNAFAEKSVIEILPSDPTQPKAFFSAGAAVESDAVDFQLSWMITGKKNNMAVVNGQRVQQGDFVDGAEVLSITPQGVMLNVGNQEKLISLSERKGFSKTKRGN